jgi:hypothetical protein
MAKNPKKNIGVCLQIKKKNISKIISACLKIQKALYGFYNQFVKFQRILAYISKNIKNYF